MGNKEQQNTLHMLAGIIDSMTVAAEDDGALVFEGWGADGKMLGYVETNGTVTWIAGA